MSPTATVRPAREDDLAFILRLQETSQQAPQWSANHYHQMLRNSSEAPHRLLLIAEFDDAAAGYAAASAVLDEAELEAIVVDQEHRREGIGQALTSAVAIWATRQGARSLRLEVRASNHAALSLYAATGFEPVGNRKGYYSNPVEDAVLLSMRLG